MGRKELDTVVRLERAASRLAARTIDSPDLPWVQGLDAEVRGYVALVVHAGINAFAAWMRDPLSPASASGALSAAPRAITRTVSLADALQLFRVAVAVVEGASGEVSVPGTEAWLRDRTLVFSREVALAIARVYADAAEERGAWDARLQALLIDGLLSGESPTSLTARAGSLGWDGATPVVVVAAALRPAGVVAAAQRPAGVVAAAQRPAGVVAAAQRPAGVAAAAADVPELDPEEAVDAVQRVARRAGLSAVAGMRGTDLVIVLGGAADPLASVPGLLRHLEGLPVVVSHAVTDLAAAGPAAAAALTGLHVLPGWPQAPRPVTSGQLLPERAIAGDLAARAELVTTITAAIAGCGPAVVPTLACYLEEAGSLEECARRMVVHVNTVRYRLAQVTAATGLRAGDPRDSFVLRVALMAARLPAPA